MRAHGSPFSFCARIRAMKRELRRAIKESAEQFVRDYLRAAGMTLSKKQHRKIVRELEGRILRTRVAYDKAHPRA